MNKKFVSIILFFAFSLTASSQSKQQINQAVSTSSVDFYMEQYEFEEAEIQLKKNITMLKKKRQSTEQAEQMLKEIERLKRMLLATEKVTFIDSFVVNKINFLEHIKLSTESGTLDTYTHFFGRRDTMDCTVFRSELGNKIFFSQIDEKGYQRLFTSDLIGDKWNTPVAIKGLNEDDSQNYPFLMSDGMTLYYAAEGEESLGGYDIFVSRFNTDEGKFLRPENIGMPFNSPANDYMFAIDEINNLGWFVTDRNQPEDKVCIYVFIPTDTREIYNTADTIEVRRAARISSISDTWKKTELVESARIRLESALNTEKETIKPKDFDFVINNQITYTLTTDFKSPEAKRIIAGWKENTSLLKQLHNQLQELRNEYASGNASRKNQLKQQILTLEQNYENLIKNTKDQEKKIRNAEISFLKK